MNTKRINNSLIWSIPFVLEKAARMKTAFLAFKSIITKAVISQNKQRTMGKLSYLCLISIHSQTEPNKNEQTLMK